MKYQPSLPQENDNISAEHPLKDFAVILAWLLAAAALVIWLLGLAVDSVVDRMSHETEASLNKMLPAFKIETDPALAPRQVQLQALVDSMRSCAGMRLPAKLSVHKSEAPNAMVVPGGNIVVFSGLTDHVVSENGLAFVLAHEMGHLTQRDHLRAMGRGIVLFGVAAVLTGSDSGLTEILAPANQLGQAKYSRTRESAADAVALRILNCRYGHAGGATELFEAMQGRDDRLFGLSHYVASHPAMRDRIGAIDATIRAEGMQRGPVKPLPLPRPAGP